MAQSVLIKDTTREEREEIVRRGLSFCGDGSCEQCSGCSMGVGSNRRHVPALHRRQTRAGRGQHVARRNHVHAGRRAKRGRCIHRAASVRIQHRDEQRIVEGPMHARTPKHFVLEERLERYADFIEPAPQDYAGRWAELATPWAAPPQQAERRAPGAFARSALTWAVAGAPSPWSPPVASRTCSSSAWTANRSAWPTPVALPQRAALRTSSSSPGTAIA